MPEPYTLPIQLDLKVGYRGENRNKDVQKVHWLLSKVPGGTSQLVGKPYSPGETQKAILAFQVAQFRHNTRLHDACIWPSGETLKRMNALASVPGGKPAPAPPAAPAPSTGRVPRPIVARVAAAPHEYAYVKGYSEAASVGRFRVPTYLMGIGPAAADGSVMEAEAKLFEVITWGVRCNSDNYNANKPFTECFSVAAPRFGTFTMSAFNSKSLGKCWKLEGAYLLHDGPGSPRWLPSDDTGSGLVGALGCVEVCGKQSWTTFMQMVHTMAFGAETYAGMSYDEADRLLETHHAFTITVETSARPALRPITDFRAWLPGAPVPAAA